MGALLLTVREIFWNAPKKRSVCMSIQLKPCADVVSLDMTDVCRGMQFQVKVLIRGLVGEQAFLRILAMLA